MGWIDELTDQVARTRGLDPEALRVTPKEAGTILDIARIAAHASGARTNAPLLSYALGKAAALSGVPLETLAEDVRAVVTGDPDEAAETSEPAGDQA